MMKIASSCPPKDGGFMMGYSSAALVGVGAGDQRDGRISNSSSSSNINITIAGGLTKNTNRRTAGPGRPKMDQDSGFGSRSPTPGSSGDWKDTHQNGGSFTGEIIKSASAPPTISDVTESLNGGSSSSKESGSKGSTHATQNGHDKGDRESHGDCKGSYENSRSYYDSNSNSNHSSGSGQYKKYYNNNQQYGYGGYNNQRRYNNNNNYRNYGNRNSSKPWTKGGSRSPSLHDEEWKENGDCNRSYRSSSSDTTIGHEDASVISLVECHNKLALDTPEDIKQGDKTNDNATNQAEDKEDSRKHRNQNYNNHSSGSGQYKRNSNQQYTNGYNTQRRYNSNNYHYNNYRNYGNNRRQFQQHNDYYYHQQNQHYSHNNHNDGYYQRPGPNRGYSMHSPSSYNNQRRGNGPPLSPSEYEECLPWPAKRGNWPHSHNEGFSINVNHFQGLDKACYTTTARQCSPPDTSPTSTDSSGPFLLAAQHLGPYDYLMGNMSNQQNGANGGFQYSAAYTQTSYFYSYPPVHAAALETAAAILPQPATISMLVPTDGNSNRSETSAISTVNDKSAEWADNISEHSDPESVGNSSTSTACNTPDELSLDELPALTNDVGKRLYSDSSALAKNGLSTTGLLFRPAKRLGLPAFIFPREWFEDFDPEEIVAQFSRAGEVKERPQALTGLGHGSVMDSLSEAIWTKFFMNQQTTETFRKKVELWRDVYRVVRILNFAPDFKHDPRNFPTFGLQVVGSTMSGFGSNTSDVDMCLLMRASEVDQRYEAVDRLQSLCHTLKVLPCVESQELIYAKVPILKFRDANRRLEVDLNCNNFVGLRNTHLLYSYAQMDWRLKPLVLVVKLWAQYHRINDAKNMTISSYSLVLMVIHFLQCGVGDPVLPVLQEMYPEKFNNTNPILSVNIHESIPSWESRNKMGLGELLIEFLDYYSRKFDYTRNAISVRLGGIISIKSAANFRSVKNDPHQWKFLCVEEPFDRTNTARSVYDRDIFDRIQAIFFSSWQRLQASKSLESIFSPLSDADALNISCAVSKIR